MPLAINDDTIAVDDALLRACLTRTPADVGTVRVLDNGSMYMSGAGWYILQTYKNILVMDLGIPVMVPTLIARSWRKRLIRAARRADVTILPVSRQAFGRAAADGDEFQVHDINDQFETVFSTHEGNLPPKFYLSGYDTQETPPLYFLCQLPHPVVTIAEARESLKPESVKAALAADINVARQGDIFAIESDVTTQQLKDMGAKLFKTTALRKRIYGTAHTATQLARLPDATMLAKGELQHNPRLIGQQRYADHRPRVLGDRNRWWWLTRNTVPIAH